MSCVSTAYKLTITYIMQIKPYIGGKAMLYWYSIYRYGKVVEKRLLGWRTALAHARKYTSDLFYEKECKKIEILNEYTGEIISLEEAERRTAGIKFRQ